MSLNLIDEEAGKAAVRRALLCADRYLLNNLSLVLGRSTVVSWKNALMNELTDGYINGQVPFCQLTAVAYAAQAVNNDNINPIACCGALEGNTSVAGNDHMMMLMKAWGIPYIDLGLDVAPEKFIDAISEHGLKYVICMAFNEENAQGIYKVNQLAVRQGIRKQFSLLLCGVMIPKEKKEKLPLDCEEFRTATAARWIGLQWKR